MFSGPSGVSIEKDNTSNQQIIVIGKNIQIKPPYRADCISVLTKVNMADDSLNYAKKLVCFIKLIKLKKKSNFLVSL